MSTINTIVDKICEYHREHDTIEFYFKIHECMSECLFLINQNLLEEDEKEIILQAKKMWNKKNYDDDVIKNLHFLILNKKIKMNRENRDMKRYSALSAIQGTMMTFEAWNDNEVYRSDSLEFFIGNMIASGVSENILHMVIKKEFIDFL
jgi:hypothetical protein